MFAIPFPAIDPIAIELGPVVIRWYALAYVVGILIGWWYALRVARRPPGALTTKDVDDLVVWITLGVILGGRLGYVLFYKPGFYFSNPFEIVAVWHGGMSFHGGLIGVIVAMALFAWHRKQDFFVVSDMLAAAGPIGLFLGRIANFINAELYGRETDVPWAMKFPGGGDVARHPSQLYEASLEGVVLFAILYWLAFRTRALERPGIVGGVFLAGYAVARSIVEMFRQPDPFMPDFPLGITMGQILSLPVLLAGAYLIWRARSQAGPKP